MTLIPVCPPAISTRSAGLLRPACVLPDRVGLDNPALDVMTDFRRLTAFIATPGDTIRQAEERMIRRKVRLLFVMDGEDRVAGLITNTDIHGEKPMQVVQSRGIRRDEVLVADIMTPVERLEAVDLRRHRPRPRRPRAGNAQGTRPPARAGDRKRERPADGARPAVPVAAVQTAGRHRRNHRSGEHLHRNRAASGARLNRMNRAPARRSSAAVPGAATRIARTAFPAIVLAS